MEIDNTMNVENIIFQQFKEYLISNAKYTPKVYPSTPKKSPKFPLVIFREQNNTDILTNRSLDRTQRAYQITDVVEIYTQDIISNTETIASKVVMNSLKYLVFDFFEFYGFERTSCTPAESFYEDTDRLVMTFVVEVNNWNRKIS